jgi:outer membrane protein TolC
MSDALIHCKIGKTPSMCATSTTCEAMSLFGRWWRYAWIILLPILTVAAGCTLTRSSKNATDSNRSAPLASVLPATTAVPFNTQPSGIKTAQVVLPAPDRLTHNTDSSLMKLDSVLAVPPAALEQIIDVQVVLTMANRDNPRIGLAEEAVRASEAERLQARALLLPTINTGFNFRIHSGNLLSSSGIIRYDNVDSLYAGLGAFAKGADTPTIPGVRILANLGEATFAPRIAGWRVLERQFDATATQHQVLLQVAERYFDLLSAEARLQALEQSQSELAELVRLTANFAKTGEGREGDAERARSEELLLQTEMHHVEEEAATAAADLARLFNADPAVRLHADPGNLSEITLVDENANLEELLQTAINNRPEAAARAAQLRQAEIRLRQERVRPLLPIISIGFSYGTFGGGGNLVATPFGNFNSRVDFDAGAVWTLENLGVGNHAVKKRASAQVNAAYVAESGTLDDIRRQVAETQALATLRHRQIDIAQHQIQRAQDGFREELTRTKNLKGRLIEVLNSLNQLKTARQALIQAMAGFNQAQFELFIALGNPPIP